MIAIDILSFVGGLVLVIVGASFLTDGSASIAKRLGMSDFIVGLTIVSMMTSAPELVVSVTGALNAETSMAIGNVVGSNVFNVLMIIGITALIKPISVTRGVLVAEIPIVILASAVLLIMGSSPWLDGTPMAITRVDGLLLLIFFILFLRHTLLSGKNATSDDPTSADGGRQKQLPVWSAVLYTVGGLGALIYGGNLFVKGAVGIATAAGWSEALIGLTIIAAGTSLPELATSVSAAVKGYPGLCIGNVIGSNIFNIFFVLGITATIKPLQFGSIGMPDLLVMTGAALLFWVTGWLYGHRIIKRAEGAVMVFCYVAYMTYLYFGI